MPEKTNKAIDGRMSDDLDPTSISLLPTVNSAETQNDKSPNSIKTAPIFSDESIPVNDVAINDVAGMLPQPIATATSDRSIESVPAPNDSSIDELVDDIIGRESDELLAARDAAHASAEAPPRLSMFGRIKASVARAATLWWHNKPARYGTLALLFIALSGLLAVPNGRYFVLNTAGVKTAASVKILDNSTQLPLKNVAVTIGDVTAVSNKQGDVRLQGLKLGSQQIIVKQLGFAAINKPLTLGLGSNPLGDLTLEAVGIQVRYKLTDALSGKPVTNAEIASGDANAQADKQGLVVLTLDKSSNAMLNITITAVNYRVEKQKLDIAAAVSGQPMTIKLVSAKPVVFISKQTGKFDLSQIDIDGKNRKILLAASGFEDADMTVAQHPGGDRVALISKRDQTKNQDGFQLQALTIVDSTDGEPLKLDHSERFQIVDWIDDKLIYIKIKAGTSAGNPERYQLISYDSVSGARLQLAAANYFNDVLSADGSLYVAASNNYQGGTSQFFKIDPDNTSRQTLIDKTDVYNISRTAHDILAITAVNGTYAYKLGEPSAKKTAESATTVAETRFYLDAADGQRSIWTEKRDGQGVLLLYNTETGKDTVITAQTGLTYPLRWHSNKIIVYRVMTERETADYAVNLDGGAPVKIVDLTNTFGIGRLNYR